MLPAARTCIIIASPPVSAESAGNVGAGSVKPGMCTLAVYLLASMVVKHVSYLEIVGIAVTNVQACGSRPGRSADRSLQEMAG